MAGSPKKVIVRRFLGDVLWGYLPGSDFVRSGAGERGAGEGGARGFAERHASSGLVVDLLDLSGKLMPLPLAEVKHIAYVRDFNTSDGVNPERLMRRSFLARPRTEGLWVRLTFQGGDVLEGMAAPDLSLLEGMQADAGLQVTPPDTRSNTRRLYVPRSALSGFQCLAVVTAPSRRKGASTGAEGGVQEDLFGGLVSGQTELN